jgi:hypothetical protein
MTSQQGRTPIYKFSKLFFKLPAPFLVKIIRPADELKTRNMKNLVFKMSLSAILLISAQFAFSQEEWPKWITMDNGTVINLYQPQTENFSGNKLTLRLAISVAENGSQQPEFGVCWINAVAETDKDKREVTLESVNVKDLKFQGDSGIVSRVALKPAIESHFLQLAGVLPLDELLSSLDDYQTETKQSENINSQLPQVYYRNKPSMLVLIDGDPKIKTDPHTKLDRVLNTPFTMIRFSDGKFYLYGEDHWYVAPAATGPYTYTNDKVDRKLKKVAREIKKAAEKNGDGKIDEPAQNPVDDILVSMSPAELIQTDGEPNLVPIAGTSLLYVKNSDNDIFVDTQSQQYYVLLSGRWYSAKGLGENNTWTHIAASELPADFAKIPEGSPKDAVLASIAGTPEAKEAVIDAQIPQTAKVDRKSANTNIVYDGQASFQPIEGTDMQYAVNTSSTVFLEQGVYYAVDNGIWFTATDPMGPWSVSNNRPAQIDQIPPSCPAYNAKFVYIYDSTPDYVYEGYTSGYLNSFVDGPTLVYGTGFYYGGWWGNFYYPRPWTWGFGMCYNPWTGWGFGAGFGYDWFDDWWFWDIGFGWGGWWGGGWWGGAAFYRPVYRDWHGGRFTSDRRGGYYGRNAVVNQGTHMHMHYNNNVYRGRPGVVAPPERGGTAVSGNNGSRSSSATGRTIMTDRQGNVYQKAENGNWQQRVNKAWTPAPATNTQRLNTQNQNSSRGAVRATNFQHASNFGSIRSGGGARFSGGGGGGRGGRR